MIKDLISKALGGEGAKLLEGMDLSSDMKDKALDLAKDSISDGLKESVAGGNIGNITSAFSGGSSSSLVQSITSNYGSSLITKLGISESMAKTISTTLIPMVFNYINKNDDAPTDSDEGVKGMLGDLVGGNIKDSIGGMLKDKLKF
jgi:hypothetical protein